MVPQDAVDWKSLVYAWDLKKNNEGRRIIEKLFKEISSKPRKFLTFSTNKHNKYRSIADYISGMTDRFAINIYKSLKWIYLKNIKTN